MSSVQLQGESVTDQLTPAEETFTGFKERLKKSNEETDDRNRLLDFTRIPQIILHRIGFHISGVICKISDGEMKPHEALNRLAKLLQRSPQFMRLHVNMSPPTGGQQNYS